MKRPGSSLDSSFNDKYPVVGSKRPVRERLGGTVDSSAEFNNKRFLCLFLLSFVTIDFCFKLATGLVVFHLLYELMCWLCTSIGY